MSQAKKEVKASQPRRATRPGHCSRARPHRALASTLTGPGRPHKLTQLVGREGGRYTGEVVAGHPQGVGQLLVPCRSGSREYMIVYDGEWVQVLLC